ncbi:hypothetical protein P8452_48492 [Trifolium repens]|nr:hypothetical protein P8452_48492 [Trifolium repens]
MVNLKYLDDESGMEVGIFQSLEVLILMELPNLKGLLKVEKGQMFPRLSKLRIDHCPKLGLSCLPSVEELFVWGYNDELLRSISNFCGLTTLTLHGDGAGTTSFPEMMFRKLTSLQYLKICKFPKLKELRNEPFNLALEILQIAYCDELESLPEQIWESLQSLRYLEIENCIGFRCLPEAIRNLTSLESLDIQGCPTLQKRCRKESEEDWDKIAHIPEFVISRGVTINL